MGGQKEGSDANSSQLFPRNENESETGKVCNEGVIGNQTHTRIKQFDKKENNEEFMKLGEIKEESNKTENNPNEQETKTKRKRRREGVGDKHGAPSPEVMQKYINEIDEKGGRDKNMQNDLDNIKDAEDHNDSTSTKRNENNSELESNESNSKEQDEICGTKGNAIQRKIKIRGSRRNNDGGMCTKTNKTSNEEECKDVQLSPDTLNEGSEKKKRKSCSTSTANSNVDNTQINDLMHSEKEGDNKPLVFWEFRKRPSKKS